MDMSDVRRVAVFRALNLGDMLCCMPALRALRNALPHAQITLIGLPSAVPVMPYFSTYLDELVEFPGNPAFPEQSVRIAALPEFYRAMRARKFDLALQMHGSGQQSNDIVRALEPSRWAGFVPDVRQIVPGQCMLWPERLPEIIRYLALLAYMGLDAEDQTLEFPLSTIDQENTDELIAHSGLDVNRLVLVHPGARLASRRWPLDRYRAVAQALADAGWQLAITGSEAEKSMSHELLYTGAPVIDLCGMTSLGTLAGLLKRARLLICNDTGVSHVAASVRCRSVVIACGSDVERWRPRDFRLHTVLHRDPDCRPCAYDACPVGHTCALELDVSDVLDAAFHHLGEPAP